MPFAQQKSTATGSRKRKKFNAENAPPKLRPKPIPVVRKGPPQPLAPVGQYHEDNAAAQPFVAMPLRREDPMNVVFRASLPKSTRDQLPLGRLDIESEQIVDSSTIMPRRSSSNSRDMNPVGTQRSPARTEHPEPLPAVPFRANFLESAPEWQSHFADSQTEPSPPYALGNVYTE